jgi:hypothetical protein
LGRKQGSAACDAYLVEGGMLVVDTYANRLRNDPCKDHSRNPARDGRPTWLHAQPKLTARDNPIPLPRHACLTDEAITASPFLASRTSAARTRSHLPETTPCKPR